MDLTTIVIVFSTMSVSGWAFGLGFMAFKRIMEAAT
jgi:hypothetical protein